MYAPWPRNFTPKCVAWSNYHMCLQRTHTGSTAFNSKNLEMTQVPIDSTKDKWTVEGLYVRILHRSQNEWVNRGTQPSWERNIEWKGQAPGEYTNCLYEVPECAQLNILVRITNMCDKTIKKSKGWFTQDSGITVTMTPRGRGWEQLGLQCNDMAFSSYWAMGRWCSLFGYPLYLAYIWEIFSVPTQNVM